MLGRSAADAPVRERDGLVSRSLLRKGVAPGEELTATWGDVAHGSRQRSHDHDAEQQVYAVLRGRGRMRAGGEERKVGRGDLVYVPSGAARGVENESGEPLVYVSSATPAMDALKAYDAGRLRAEAESEEEA